MDILRLKVTLEYGIDMSMGWDEALKRYSLPLKLLVVLVAGMPFRSNCESLMSFEATAAKAFP